MTQLKRKTSDDEKFMSIVYFPQTEFLYLFRVPCYCTTFPFFIDDLTGIIIYGY